MTETLKIADKEFTSRLFTGTGKFSSSQLMRESLLASESELITVALKRVDITNEDDDILTHLDHPHINLLPNTSGVRTAKEAVFAAQLAREALETNWVKLEIHPDPRYLLPDPIETLKAAEELVKLGFVVMPYIHADPVLCKRLEEVGHAAHAMEIGADAVLVNTAIAVSQNPVTMAKAFKMGVEAGRMAYEAKLATVKKQAEASSPLTSFLS